MRKRCLTDQAVSSHLLPTYARVDLAFERGEGAWLFTADGERYLDFTSGVAVNALGHAHPHLVEALTEQAQKVWHVSNLYRIPEGERLADRLCAAELCRHRVFPEFRRRGDRMRDQDGAQISVRLRQARALPHHHLRRRLPRPHAGRRSPRPATRNISKASARRSTGFDQVPFGDLEAVKKAIGPETAAILIEPIRARAACGWCRTRSCARCASCATTTACC